MFIKAALKQLFLPPGLFIIGILAGLIIWAVAKWKGRALVILSSVLLLISSLPIASSALLDYAQGDTAILGQVTDEQAIVILSAGVNVEAAEYGGATLDVTTLERVRYGAHLHRLSKLPVLVTGGVDPTLAEFDQPEGSVAEMMARSLDEEFGIPVKWVEAEAANTWQNATMTAGLLRPEGVERILLVTHGWHMPRARRAFEQMGFDVTPAPTGLISTQIDSLNKFLPSFDSLRVSYYACHELVGSIYYRIRFRA